MAVKEVVGYECPGCEDLHEGSPSDLSTEKFFRVDNLVKQDREGNDVVLCDDVSEVELADMECCGDLVDVEDIEQGNDLWKCTVCDELYVDEEEARDCCAKEFILTLKFTVKMDDIEEAEQFSSDMADWVTGVSAVRNSAVIHTRSVVDPSVVPVIIDCTLCGAKFQTYDERVTHVDDHRAKIEEMNKIEELSKKEEEAV